MDIEIPNEEMFSRYVKQPTIKDKLLNVCTNISTCFIITVTGATAFGFIHSSTKLGDVPSKYFMKNQLNMPLTLPINGDDIRVVIDQNFSYEQKQVIKEAIEELDVDLNFVTYTVDLDCTKAPYKSIRINKVENIYGNALALTTVKSWGVIDYIRFPINIDVQINKIVSEEKISANEKEYTKGIIKHEMLHTFGLDDLYDSEEQNKTLMYGFYGSGSNYVHDLTERDKEILHKVYKSNTATYNVSTTLPSQMDITIKKRDPDLNLEF